MFRFIHSADWQLGARFAMFGQNAERLRAQRLITLRKALEVARARQVDAFLVAGDLFEDNQVADTLVEETLRIFADFPDVMVCLLPGNHDPACGPSAVWSRRQFRDGALPRNVVVLQESKVVPLGDDCLLLASPLHQKVSTVDPSLRLRDLGREQPADCVRIGLTHGALAIPGKHQPHDFPIDVNAATRAGLDYLGIGHWHNWQVYDAERLVMPGTPEPDAFDQENSGFVAYVEIDGPGAVPRVERVPVGGLRWMHFGYECGELDRARAALEAHAAALGGQIGTSVCRVRLQGAAAFGEGARAEQWLRELFREAVHCLVDDATYPVLSPGEIAALEREHPILCQVLADLDQLELLATGALSLSAVAQGAPAGVSSLTLTEAQALVAKSKTELGMYARGDFDAARQLLFAGLHEVAATGTVCV